MDIAYDHVQEEALAPKSETKEAAPSAQQLNTEFQEAFKAVSSSPWGETLGGWFSQARKQGEALYNDLQKEATEASAHATKGLTSLREQVVNRTRGMTLNAEPGPWSEIPGEEGIPGVTGQATARPEKESKKPESLPVDIVKDAGSLVASLRSTAAAKMKELQRAEDAADEALLRFGSNLRAFLRDAVTISSPDDDDASKPRESDGVGNEVLFETQEPGTGKKVFHSTRLDAQLHAIHTNPSSFTDDHQGEEWEAWKKSFDAGKQVEETACDLEKYEELRRAMEKLVPEKVEYKTFWTRYYFLRKAVQEDEKRRKEILKGAATDAGEEVSWDDDEEEGLSTPQPEAKASESTTTLHAPYHRHEQARPKESRRSEDEKQSVADSDASYDLVSGTTSRALGSPKNQKKDGDESEDDWE